MPRTKLDIAGPPKPKRAGGAPPVQQPIPIPKTEAASDLMDAPRPKQRPQAKPGPQPPPGAQQAQAGPAREYVTPETIKPWIAMGLGAAGDALGSEPKDNEIQEVAEAAAIVANKHGGKFKYADEASLVGLVGMVAWRMFQEGRKNRDAEAAAARGKTLRADNPRNDGVWEVNAG